MLFLVLYNLLVFIVYLPRYKLLVLRFFCEGIINRVHFLSRITEGFLKGQYPNKLTNSTSCGTFHILVFK